MPRVEFEPTTPVSERRKTVNALDCAATVIGVIKRGFINFTLVQIAAEAEVPINPFTRAKSQINDSKTLPFSVHSMQGHLSISVDTI
jgi:hypothetical protein